VWQASYASGGAAIDTITIKPDGTYQQEFATNFGYHYKGDWNKWWVEKRPSGCLYLHLDRMRYFVDGLEEADQMANGASVTLLEMCEDQVLVISKEMVLTITSAPHLPPGIRLLQLKSDADLSNNYFLPVVPTPMPADTSAP
jgi:hypothetical protein